MRAASTTILGALVCMSTAALSQTSTGSVFGRVADAKGFAVPDAAVTVKSTDLATARVTHANASGEFSMSGLVPGAYTVESAKGALKLKRSIRITVGLGSTTQLALRLDIAEVKQRATVNARAANSEGNTTTPPINQSEASVSTFFAGTVVTYLPNRDRDVTQYDPLAADAHDTDEGASFAGQRASALLTQVDDVSFSGGLFGSANNAEVHGFFLPQTVVREFQLVTSGASAEVGTTSAGLVNVATKEGSNRLHGEAFYTARPATLTSADAFGNTPRNFANSGGMNNFGWSEGGAIRKNRLFFYAGLEQDILHVPRYAEFAPQAAGLTVPGALTALQGEIDERDTPLALSGRLDAVLNDSNMLNVELAGSRVRMTHIEEGGAYGETRTLSVGTTAAHESGQDLFGKVGLATVFGASVVNRARLALVGDHRGVTPNSTGPELSINGFGVLGGTAMGAHLYTSRQVQVGDDVAVGHGKTLLTFGAAFEGDPSYEQREEDLNGRFDYNTLSAYLSNAPRRFQQTFVTGNTRYSAAVKSINVYANERVELRPGLTLTAGLRWAAQWNPQPGTVSFAVPVAIPVGGGSVSAPNVSSQTIPNDQTQWQPRLGVAWSATRRTVVRASSGLYDAATPSTLFHRVFADNGTQTVTVDSYFDAAALIGAGGLTPTPHALSGVPVGLTTPEALVVGIDRGFKNPRSLLSALSVDETVSPKLTLRGEYLHAATWRLDRTVDENLAPPSTNAQGIPVFLTPRPIAGVGRLLRHESTAYASYDGVSLSAISQISRRSQVTVNYTLSKTRDGDSSDGPYAIGSALNPFNLKAESAYSNLDVRNVLNVAGIFNLPLGLKLNPLVVAQSGAPYTGLIGFDTQNDANDFNDRGPANGVETPRNLYRGPAFFDSDVRLVKDFTLKGEGHHLDLFMDVFNITGATNRNFGPDQVSLFGNTASPLSSAAHALFAPGTTRLGGPREFQFTARLVGF